MSGSGSTNNSPSSPSFSPDMHSSYLKRYLGSPSFERSTSSPPPPSSPPPSRSPAGSRSDSPSLADIPGSPIPVAGSPVSMMDDGDNGGGGDFDDQSELEGGDDAPDDFMVKDAFQAGLIKHCVNHMSETTTLQQLIEMAEAYIRGRVPSMDELFRSAPKRKHFMRDGFLATVEFRSAIDYMFIQHQQRTDGGKEEEFASLLHAAIKRNFHRLAKDIVHFLLEWVDLLDVQSMTNFRAYIEPTVDLRTELDFDDEGSWQAFKLYQEVDGLLLTSQNLSVNYVGLEYVQQYAKFTQAAPYPDQFTKDRVPRITLLIHAHGADLYAGDSTTPSSKKPAQFHFPGFGGTEDEKGKLLVQFFGPGRCDVHAYGTKSGSTADKWRNEVWKATRSHEPDVDKTMQELRPRLHELYASEPDVAAKHKREGGYDVLNDSMSLGEGGKMPHLDRQYSCDPKVERQPRFAPGIVQIVQSFNNNTLNSYVGATLFSVALKEGPDAARDMVNKWCTADRIEDGMIQDDLRLSHILQLCQALGYQDVSVFDYSCRTMNPSAETPGTFAARRSAINNADIRGKVARAVNRLENKWPPELPTSEQQQQQQQQDDEVGSFEQSQDEMALRMIDPDAQSSPKKKKKNVVRRPPMLPPPLPPVPESGSSTPELPPPPPPPADEVLQTPPRAARGGGGGGGGGGTKRRRARPRATETRRTKRPRLIRQRAARPTAAATTARRRGRRATAPPAARGKTGRRRRRT